MKKKLFAGLAVGVMMFGMAGLVYAIPITALNLTNIPAGGYDGNQLYTGSLGFDFDVNQSIYITALGAFDDNSNGLSRSITVRLWNRTGTGSTATGSQIVNASTPLPAIITNGTLENGYVFKNLTSWLLLTPAQYTLSASGYGGSEENGNTNHASTPAYARYTDNAGGVISFLA